MNPLGRGPFLLYIHSMYPDPSGTIRSFQVSAFWCSHINTEVAEMFTLWRNASHTQHTSFICLTWLAASRQ